MMNKTNYSISNSVSSFMAFVVLSTVSLATSASQSMHEKIEEGTKKYLLSQLSSHDQDSNVDVAVVKIDERINIPQCPTGFQFNSSADALAQSHISVRVSCGDNDWYLFTSGHVTRTTDIVVTRGAVSPGTVLTSSNLSIAKVDVRKLRFTAFTDVDALIGARVKRRITDGQALQSNMLCFVCKGDRITITAEVAGMKVKTAGIAQQDGVVGDNIKVVNASSQKAIVARVASSDEVVIHL
ncbi:flagellar basal body P-ring formation chaperone FlgA [Alteromonas gracilis]|uniref:flagellar basal body P-ring formation chaperone FlgA n=1 Tax=Alteromonas gracilis TaxID=1479524 RepID=UPI0030CD639A